MSVGRDRKEAAKRLGIALQTRYRKLIEANGQDEITVAAVDLGQCFNDNVEFVIWVLRTYGGESLMPPERRRGRPTLIGIDQGKPGVDHTVVAAMQDNEIVGMAVTPAGAPLKMPAIFSAGADVDMPRK